MTAVLDTPETTTPKPASLAQIHRYFAGDNKSYTLAKFRSDWSELTDTDKTSIREGIGNGSFTY